MGSSRGRLRQVQVLTGRCNLPCGRKDARLRSDPGPLEHRCVLDWGHPGRCDFIGTCLMDLRKSRPVIAERLVGLAEVAA